MHSGKFRQLRSITANLGDRRAKDVITEIRKHDKTFPAGKQHISFEHAALFLYVLSALKYGESLGNVKSLVSYFNYWHDLSKETIRQFLTRVLVRPPQYPESVIKEIRINQTNKEVYVIGISGDMINSYTANGKEVPYPISVQLYSVWDRAFMIHMTNRLTTK